MAGIRSIINVIQTQIQDIRAQQSRALNKQREFAPAFAQAFRNTGGFFTPEQFDKRFNALSKELPSADPTELANALGGSLSAVGVTNKQEAEMPLTPRVLHFDSHRFKTPKRNRSWPRSAARWPKGLRFR